MRREEGRGVAIRETSLLGHCHHAGLAKCQNEDMRRVLPFLLLAVLTIGAAFGIMASTGFFSSQTSVHFSVQGCSKLIPLKSGGNSLKALKPKLKHYTAQIPSSLEGKVEAYGNPDFPIVELGPKGSTCLFQQKTGPDFAINQMVFPNVETSMSVEPPMGISGAVGDEFATVFPNYTGSLLACAYTTGAGISTCTAPLVRCPGATSQSTLELNPLANQHLVGQATCPDHTLIKVAYGYGGTKAISQLADLVARPVYVYRCRFAQADWASLCDDSMSAYVATASRVGTN